MCPWARHLVNCPSAAAQLLRTEVCSRGGKLSLPTVCEAIHGTLSPRLMQLVKNVPQMPLGFCWSSQIMLCDKTSHQFYKPGSNMVKSNELRLFLLTRLHVRPFHLGLHHSPIKDVHEELWIPLRLNEWTTNIQENFIHQAPERGWQTPPCWKSFCWCIHYFVCTL